MSDAVVKERWNHTAVILAMTANCHRDPKKSRAFKPADFHPYMRPAARKSGVRITAGNIGILNRVFVKKGSRK